MGDPLTLETADERALWCSVFAVMRELLGTDAAGAQSDHAVRAYRERTPEPASAPCECGVAVLWHEQGVGSCTDNEHYQCADVEAQP